MADLTSMGGYYRRHGVNLTRVRLKAGLTQAALAARLGVAQSTVSDLEAGKRRLDTVEVIWLSRQLGVSPKVLFAALIA